MAKYGIAWLPGDGSGRGVLEGAEVIPDKVALEAADADGPVPCPHGRLLEPEPRGFEDRWERAFINLTARTII